MAGGLVGRVECRELVGAVGGREEEGLGCEDGWGGGGGGGGRACESLFSFFSFCQAHHSGAFIHLHPNHYSTVSPSHS